MKDPKKYSLRLYQRLKTSSKRIIEKGNYNKALNLLRTATWIQFVFSNVYYDEEIESQLKAISSNILIDDYDTQELFVFYDDFSLDNLGLTQQYLRALISSGHKIVFVTPKLLGTDDSKDIFKEINEAPNVEYVRWQKTGDLFENSNRLAHLLSSFRPQKLFIQSQPNSVEVIAAVYALSHKTVKYMIDIQDHAYWVGANAVDYDIVFRSYGYNIAEHFRGICTDKILQQPYYPIYDINRPFEGLPDGIDNKVKIISGGAFHKVYSEDRIFQKFVMRVLDDNPNTVYLFAGSGNPAVFDIITRQEKYKNRFFLLGQRKDIFQVLSHSDIYVNTFPFDGGLMGQLAAHCKLPIMAFAYPESGGQLESVVCQKDFVSITCPDLNSMYDLLVQCINDKEKRKNFGLRIGNCVVDQDWFNDSFVQLISSNKTTVKNEIAEDSFFYKEAHHNRIMQVEQEYYIWILQHLKIETIAYCPAIVFATIISFMNKDGISRLIRKIVS